MTIASIFKLTEPVAPSNFQDIVKEFYAYLGHTASAKELVASLETHQEIVDGIPTLLGIEIEVENIGKSLAIPKAIWMQEGDNSLRNGGVEFKSVPLTPKQMLWALAVMWHVLFKGKMQPDFSWRTSIHVHANALGMSDDELKRFVVLSMVFEQLMFEIVGAGREQSNFCVPICRSSVFGSIKKYIVGDKTIMSLFKEWSKGNSDNSNGLYKYAAVNFSRLGDLGTVEFRHLGGTKDLMLVALWVTVIARLYKAAISSTTTEIKEYLKDVNESKRYKDFARHFFGTKLVSLFPEMNYEEVLAGPVTKTKELFVKMPTWEVTASSSLAEYSKHVQKQKGGAKPVKK